MSTLSIGDLLVIGANGEGSPGWSYNNIKGWYDFDQDQVDSDARPGQDGSFSADESYSSQATPSVEGIFVSGSAFEVAQAKMLLRTIKNQGLKQLIVWDDHGLVTQRQAFVVRAIPTHSAGRSGFKWAIDMFASDPALYGASLFTGPVGPLSRGDGGLRFDEYTGTTYGWDGTAGASSSFMRQGNVVARRNFSTGITPSQLGPMSLTPGVNWGGKTWTRYNAQASGSGSAARFDLNPTTIPDKTLIAAGILIGNDGSSAATVSVDVGDSNIVQATIPAGATARVITNGSPAKDGIYQFVDIQPVSQTTAFSFLFTEAVIETNGTTQPGVYFDGNTAGTGVGPGLLFPETYGALGSDGRLRIYNPGTAPSYSIFTFVGGSSLGFTITKISTAERISIEREIPLGAVVVVNPRTGRVTIDGAANDISGSLRDDDWFTTAPGVTDQVQLGILGTAYGSPTLSAETQPAY